ncbi:MAG TPA: S41 family peptidase [Gemmatimonadales bacterium]
MSMFRPVTTALGLCVVALALPSVLYAQQPQGFYRFPALHGDTVVFAAEGDLWKVAIAGGEARRLTTHPGDETSPVVSPDGRTIAFTARYEGPAEVYTMPLSGGVPVRRTYQADASIATTWTPDGKLVYTTTYYSGLPKPRLVTLDLATNTHAQVPLFEATEGTYDASGRTLYFVRPAFHNNVTKRYTGGTARDVWMFDGRNEARELTGDYRGESHSPMWWDGRVYFVTDRDGTMNLWSMDAQGGDVRQQTRHGGWDVRGTSLHNGRIAYQLGADLRLLDIASGQDRVIPITLPSDFDQLREKWVQNPIEYVTSAHLHPKGDAVVLTARGRVFVAPATQGRLVRAVRKDSVRFRDVVFMPDGTTLLGLSDETGELEFVSIPANGVGPDRRITNDGTILRFTGTPSPDGKWVAYNDNNADLWVLEVATARQRTVSQHREFAGDVAWSSDSRWLAYVEVAHNSFAQLWVYDMERGQRTAVTSDRVNSGSPAWDAKGEFLYFLSDRNLRSLVGAPWGTRQPEPYFDRQMEVYAVALRAGGRLPFRADDELAGATGATGATGVRPVSIETEGLARRIERVPVPAGNYSGLSMNAEALFMVSRESGPDAKAHLMAVKLTNRNPKAEQVVEDIRSYEMSQDGKKLLVRKGSDLYVTDAKAAKANLADARVDLRGWTFPINMRDDWRQIFVDAWRLERDYFYDPGMHGVDWDAQLAKYLPLVDRVTTRDELSDLIGWFVGELSALHTSVRGGDLRSGGDNVRVAGLGARLARDAAAGGYRIEYVYQSDPDYPDELSPLADPTLGIRVGDVITAVNGVPALDPPDIGALLRNQEGRQVLLTVRSGTTARDVIVVPTAGEFGLRYSDWEYTRRLAVEEKSDGKIGYVHLRNMGGGDLTTWYRDFYPVFDRQGLIVDVRHNGGGNIDAFILEKLMRKAWMYWQGRVGAPYWNMHYAFRGHMVVLVDQRTASDGEAFADGFRRLGLGVVIGMRTWGGEIWLSSSNTLTDRGIARAPMTGVYGPEGEWLIEQIGVIPDIEVDNLPHAAFNGSDAQLDTAVDYLLRKIAEDPRAVPPPPPYPNRRFDYPVTGR